jgi:hypothetical protein
MLQNDTEVKVVRVIQEMRHTEGCYEDVIILHHHAILPKTVPRVKPAVLLQYVRNVLEPRDRIARS